MSAKDEVWKVSIINAKAYNSSNTTLKTTTVSLKIHNNDGEKLKSAPLYRFMCVGNIFMTQRRVDLLALSNKYILFV